MRAGLASKLTVALALVAGAAPAAATGATVAVEEVTMPFQGTGEGVAECRPGTRAVGGGVLPVGGPPSLWIRASGPLDSSGVTLTTNTGDVPRQWYAAPYNGSFEERTARIFAICAARTGATIAAKQFTVDNDMERSAVVTCPAGKSALGGGVVHSGTAHGLFLNASGPLARSGAVPRTGDRPRKWYGSVQNFSDADDRIFRVFAICADRRVRIVADRFRTEPFVLNKGVARCKRGEQALGGGALAARLDDWFSASASGPRTRSGALPKAGDRPGQWFAAMNGGHGAMAAALAICG